MNKLNDEEHRRPEFSNTTENEVRTVKSTVEQKFEKNEKPQESQTKASSQHKGRPTKV